VVLTTRPRKRFDYVSSIRPLFYPPTLIREHCMKPCLGLLLITMFSITVTPAVAGDTVSGSISASGLSPPLAETALTHGVAYLDRVAADRNEVELVVILADRDLSDKIGDSATQPGAGFQYWTMQNQRSKDPIAWAKLVIDQQAKPSLDLGYGFQAQVLFDDKLALLLTHAADKRVAGSFEVLDPDGGNRGKVHFDLALSASDGIDDAGLKRLARYLDESEAAMQTVRAAYIAFAQAVREERLADASGLPNENLDLEATGRDWTVAELWPEQVYASRIKFDPGEEGGLDWTSIRARLAACGKRADGTSQQVLLSLRKFGADREWSLVARSEDTAELAPLGSAPESCSK